MTTLTTTTSLIIQFPNEQEKEKKKKSKKIRSEEQTWAPNKDMQIKPIQECKLKKFATIPSLPWNFVHIPKIPQAKASPWRHKCTDFLKPLEPGNHLCTKIAESTKKEEEEEGATKARINLHFGDHFHIIISQAN